MQYKISMETQTMPSPEPAGITERWITPPVGNSVCPFTGLRHAKFYQEFAGKPEIRQVRTGTGKHRGKRLFWLPDIYQELHRRAEAQLKGGRS